MLFHWYYTLFQHRECHTIKFYGIYNHNYFWLNVNVGVVFFAWAINSKGVKPCISNLHKLQNTLKNGDKFGLFGVQNGKAFVDQSIVLPLSVHRITLIVYMACSPQVQHKIHRIYLALPEI